MGSLNSRRYFLQKIGCFSLILGINPFDLVGLNISFDSPDDTVEYQKFLRQFKNWQNMSGLDEREAQRQYFGLLRTLAICSNPKFTSKPISKQIKTLNRAEPFKSSTAITEKERQRIYNEIFGTSEMLFDASSFAYVGTGAVVGASLKVANLLSPSYKLVLTLPRWAKIVNAVMGGAFAFRRGYNEFQERVKASVIVTGEVIKTNVYDRFYNSSGFTFENDVKGWELSISQSLTPDIALSSTDSRTAELVSFLKEELQIKQIFSNKDDLALFLDGYIERVGKSQEEILNKVLESKKKGDEQELNKQREAVALFQSIHNFIGRAILENVAAPKEAEILNTLIGAGFQFAIAGSMGPMGIAAVGISVATSLFSKRENQGFEKALFKAIQQISRQLSIINEKIDILNKNQIQIVIQLNDILSRLNDIESLITEEFRSLSLGQDRIYRAIKSTEKQDLENRYNNAKNNLEDAIKYRNEANILQNLNLLRGIATQELNDYKLTLFSDSDFSGTELKKEVYLNNLFKYNINLYDSIGLLSALANFNPNVDIGKASIEIVHPIEFFSATSTFVDYLITAAIEPRRSSDLLKEFANTAKGSMVAINNMATRSVIEDKARLFRNVGDEMINYIHDFLTDKERSDFAHGSEALRRFKLKSLNDIDLKEYFSPNGSISANDFYHNNNESPILKLLAEMKLVGAISTVSSQPFIDNVFLGSFRNRNPDPEILVPEFKQGKILGQKSNLIDFSMATIDFEKGIVASFRVPYKHSIRIQSYTHRRRNQKGCGRDGDHDCYDLYRMVTGTYTTIEIDPEWKTIIQDELKTKNIDVHKLMHSFSTMNFDEFLRHLILNWFRDKKAQYTMQLVRSFSDSKFSKFDGLGTGLMVLSKMNKLICNQENISNGINFEDKLESLSYIIDYYDEIFIREDIERLIDKVGRVNFGGEGNAIFEDVMSDFKADTSQNEAEKEMSDFYLVKPNGYYNLDPTTFSDFVAIILKRRIKETLNRSLEGTRTLTDSDCEPFLKEAELKINWYTNPT